jgi:hypothetical protein
MFTYVNCTTFPSILQAKNAGFQKIPSEQPKYTFFQTLFLSNASDAVVSCGSFSWVTITQNIFLIAIVKRM